MQLSGENNTYITLGSVRFVRVILKMNESGEFESIFEMLIMLFYI